MFKKAVSIIMVVSLLLLFCPAIFAEEVEEFDKSELNDAITTVYEYFSCLDAHRWDMLIQLLAHEDRDEFETFISDSDNKTKQIGFYNYAAVELISCISVGEEFFNPSMISSTKIDNYSDWICWECSVDVVAYRETEYLTTGNNQFLIYTARDGEGNYLIVEVLRNRKASDSNEAASTLSYDAPVPASGTGVWQVPSTINVQGYGDVDFLEYCYVVTANEFGTDSYNYEAKKAVAFAVKQYGWNRTLVQKYPYYEYDVKSTTADQAYNPSKTPSDSVISAVDATWDFVMLTCDLKLFCAFHVKNSSISSYAIYHGGILSQDGANSLGNDGYSWKEILHYYYDYGTYNSEMTQGVINIVNLNHTPPQLYYYITDDLWFHYTDCTICGCTHYEYHSWIQANDLYECTDCGLTSSYIPTIMQSLLAKESAE